MFKLYVGNLPFEITEDELVNLFGQYGTVESCNIITDRNTGQCKGFAFIEMSSKKEGEAAIEGLNETDLNGRTIKVNLPREKEHRNNRGPRTGGGGGGGGGHNNRRW